jgi:hypothetical protein
VREGRTPLARGARAGREREDDRGRKECAGDHGKYEVRRDKALAIAHEITAWWRDGSQARLEIAA